MPLYLGNLVATNFGMDFGHALSQEANVLDIRAGVYSCSTSQFQCIHEEVLSFMPRRLPTQKADDYKNRSVITLKFTAGFFPSL